MKKLIIILFLILFLFPSVCFSQNKILINEFLVDPQPQQVELINIGSERADISNWFIDDAGGATYFTIPHSSIIYPNACLVFSGDFNLNKSSSDMIRLFDSSAPPTSSSAVLIDSFSYKSSPGSLVSYQRLEDEKIFSTGSASFGFYNFKNQSCIILPTPTNQPSLIVTPSPTPSTFPTITLKPTQETALISYNNIYISEVMANPLPENKEWIEIYNDNDFSVNLDNWFIDDIENLGSTPKIFSLTIPSKDYRVIQLGSSILNNDGDSVRLLDFHKDLKDGFEYDSSTQGLTLGRKDLSNDEFCLQEQSYEKTNNPCVGSSQTPTLTITVQSITNPSPTITVIKNKISKVNNISQNNLREGDVLGESSSTFNRSTHKLENRELIKTFCALSVIYSLLTILSLLIKIKFIYGKVREFCTSFIYSPSK